MKVNIISKKQNPLLKRREVKFSIDHSQTGGTPARADIRNQLASLLGTKIELVYVKDMQTKTGSMVAVGEANVYESTEQAELVEPKHVLERNKVPEKPAKAEEAPAEETEESEEAPEEE